MTTYTLEYFFAKSSSSISAKDQQTVMPLKVSNIPPEYKKTKENGEIRPGTIIENLKIGKCYTVFKACPYSGDPIKVIGISNGSAKLKVYPGNASANQQNNCCNHPNGSTLEIPLNRWVHVDYVYMRISSNVITVTLKLSKILSQIEIRQLYDEVGQKASIMVDPIEGEVCVYPTNCSTSENLSSRLATVSARNSTQSGTTIKLTGESKESLEKLVRDDISNEFKPKGSIGAKKNENKDNTSLIIGLSVGGGTLALIVLAFAAFAFYLRKKSRKGRKNS